MIWGYFVINVWDCEESFFYNFLKVFVSCGFMELFWVLDVFSFRYFWIEFEVVVNGGD